MAQKNERIMPHSVEAEQSVLGCILIDTTIANEVMPQLSVNDFYVEAHKIIFESMLNIFKTNTTIDFVTLTNELDKTNTLICVGGAEYITHLTNFVPSASNCSHYVEILKDNTKLRNLILSANKILTESYNKSSEALSVAESEIFKISQTQDKTNLEDINKISLDVLSNFNKIQKNGVALGIPTGFFELDKNIHGLQKSDLILIAARPGVGKTSLALNIATNVSLSGKKVAMFSLEMPKEQIYQRIVCSTACVPLENALGGKLTQMDWTCLSTAQNKLAKNELYIDDSSLNASIDILSKCRRLKAKSGLDLVVVDYLQLMATPKAKENRQQEITEISRSLKIMAKELNVPVIVLSQLSRAIEGRKDHRPMLSDLRESGAIEQDADIVMFINRPDVYEIPQEVEQCELIIAKHRQGALANIPLTWLSKYTKFTNTNKSNSQQSLEMEE